MIVPYAAALLMWSGELWPKNIAKMPPMDLGYVRVSRT
jgi:hypothetical protein